MFNDYTQLPVWLVLPAIAFRSMLNIISSILRMVSTGFHSSLD